MVNNEQAIDTQLECKRLTLTAISMDHLPALFQLWSSKAMTQYINIKPLKNEAEAARMIGYFLYEAEQKIGQRYTVFYQNKIIGTCGYTGYQPIKGAVEIGYELDENYWRQGFGLEMVQRLRDHALNDLKCQYIDAIVDQDNRASIALLQRLGFKAMGHQILDDPRLDSIEGSRLYRYSVHSQ